MAFGLTDVPTLQRAWRTDLVEGGEELLQRPPDGGYFSLAAYCPGAREDGAAACQHGGVLYEGGIGIPQVSVEVSDSQPTALQRFAVSAMLLQRPYVVGSPQGG